MIRAAFQFQLGRTSYHISSGNANNTAAASRGHAYSFGMPLLYQITISR